MDSSKYFSRVGGAKPVYVYNTPSNLAGNNTVCASVNLCTLRVSLPNDDTAEDCSVCACVCVN